MGLGWYDEVFLLFVVWCFTSKRFNLWLMLLSQSCDEEPRPSDQIHFTSLMDATG